MMYCHKTAGHYKLMFFTASTMVLNSFASRTNLISCGYFLPLLLVVEFFDWCTKVSFVFNSVNLSLSHTHTPHTHTRFLILFLFLLSFTPFHSLYISYFPCPFLSSSLYLRSILSIFFLCLSFKLFWFSPFLCVLVSHILALSVSPFLPPSLSLSLLSFFLLGTSFAQKGKLPNKFVESK